MKKAERPSDVALNQAGALGDVGHVALIGEILIACVNSKLMPPFAMISCFQAAASIALRDTNVSREDFLKLASKQWDLQQSFQENFGSLFPGRRA